MSAISQKCAVSAAPKTGSFSASVARIYHAMSLMAARHHQRRQLLRLQDWQLEDIGLTRDEVMREAARPFWQ